jgi:hypothetical protein
MSRTNIDGEILGHRYGLRLWLLLLLLPPPWLRRRLLRRLLLFRAPRRPVHRPSRGVGTTYS